MSKSEYRPDATHYKVAELAIVTDETIEEVLNTWTSKGWSFDQIQFVVRDASRRPSMAFIFFVRPVAIDEKPSFEQHRIKPDKNESENEPVKEFEEGDIRWN